MPEIAEFNRFALVRPAREYLGAFRSWEKRRGEFAGSAETGERIKIAVLGFSTLESLKPYIELSCLGARLVPETYFCAYNQFFQEAFDEDSPLYAFEPDVTFVYCALEDLLESAEKNLARLPPRRRRDAVERALERLADALRAVRAGSSSTLFVCNFPRPDRLAGGFADLTGPDGLVRLFTRANWELDKAIDEMPKAHVFDLEGALLWLGRRRARDPRSVFIGDVRFADEALAYIGNRLAWLAAATRGKTRKCIVVDLDDTLWGGTVGEDGAEGVRVDDDPQGRPYRAFQQVLLDLFNKGVILAVCSKNNEADALEVFEKRRMPLTLEHFAALRINWDDKADNILSIAEELNIGVDSFVFLDDSATERAWVAARLPEVIVPELPELPSLRPDFLEHINVFDKLTLTAEDGRRSRMYVEGRKRREFAETVSREDFLKSLGLVVEVLRGDKAESARCAQLTQRTNQFNLTTRRYTADDIERMKSDPRALVLALRARDRFGDYGVIALALARRDDEARASIDTLLMSCRIIGKSVETVLLNRLCAWAADCGCGRVVGEYLPTKKNALVKDFFTRHGFRDVAGGRFELDLSRGIPEAADYIEVIE